MLPMPNLAGTYACDTTGCSLKIDPTTYALGIRLPASAPWPDPGETSSSQFPDDDRDGLPGAGVDVVPQRPSDPSACENSSGSGVQPPGMGAMAWSQRIWLGLRTQLSAAVDLGADCRVSSASASSQTIGLRSAGCTFRMGAGGPTGPMGGSTTCNDELSYMVDESLPPYEVLAAGAKPASWLPSSRGPELKAVHFAAGQPVSCEQVRMALP